MAATDSPRSQVTTTSVPSTNALLTKTSPHASLSLVNHTSQTLSFSGSTGASANSAELTRTGSAQLLLRDVRNESEGEKGGGAKRSLFRRGRGSSGREGKVRTSESLSDVREVRSSYGKQYAKMGLLMDSPTKETTPPWTHVTSGNMEIMSRSNTCSEITSRGSERSTYSERGTGSEGDFEVVQFTAEADIQSSPPITVRCEPQPSNLIGQDEVPTSSPDSGYGNTPDNPTGQGVEPGEEVDIGPTRARSGAINENKRSDTQDSAYGTGPSRGTTPTTSMLVTTADQDSGRGTSQDSGRVSASLSSDSRELEKQFQQKFANHHQSMSSMSSPPSTPSTLSPPTSTFSPPNSTSAPQFNTTTNRSPYYSLQGQSKRRRIRTGSSKHLTKSTEFSKSLAARSPPRDEKDYFQVTDELSQENAHFGLSEALLVVIEQYKATRLEQQVMEEQFPPPSSPAPVGNQTFSSASSSPYSVPSTPVDAPYLSSWGSLSSIATNPDDMPEGRVSRGMTRVSLLELMRSQPTDHSAESTAQKLLQHMAGHLSGGMKDISQMSLKLPTDFLLSLQMDEDLRKSVTTSAAHMRGSRDWAPPRKQIIYHIKQPPTKTIQTALAAQGHRCTGCGMKVDSAHSRHFRFCNYVGKYFCQNCHTNATHIIPAHILERWSFKKLPVSNFARDLLMKLQDEPVFSVNPAQHPVFRKVPVMTQAKDVRAQLVAIRQYLRTCRHGNKINHMLESVSPWTVDLSSFSLTDFVELKAGIKLKQLKTILTEAVSHVKSCPLCQGRGFVCEFCKNSNDVIFPFEANKVSICRDCRCCFHKDCFADSTPCPRCERIRERQRQRVSKIVSEQTMEEEEFGEEPVVGEPPR